ncbi:MAG: biotin--[acetyl-CoA-carboxylase] ligase [Lentisphaeraceae bacterium]|nr:biotin--[acetyl-CoA-carboxylase] ligase [Lentisphaeraceae bacterium]
MKFKIRKFDEIDSTNKYTLKNASELDDCTVTVAKVQTAGRGRKGRQWISTDGQNLYFSLLLKNPKVDFAEISGIPQLMGLAVHKSLLTAGVKNSWIKWPNDVYVDRKKICGILCESRFKGSEIEGLVIGVGVNVNSSQESLDAIDSPAISIQIATGDSAPFNTDELLHLILNNFQKAYSKWLDRHTRNELQEEWRQASRLIGKAVKLMDDSVEIYGTVADFSTNGEIIIQTERGFQNFSYGDLSLRQV